jgi:hypothetical protein
MLNQNFGDHSFKDDCEQETAMTQQLITQGMDWYQLGIAKLVPRYDKCLGCEEDHVEGCGMGVQLRPATVLTGGQNKEPKLCVL